MTVFNEEVYYKCINISLGVKKVNKYEEKLNKLCFCASVKFFEKYIKINETIIIRNEKMSNRWFFYLLMF